MMKKILLVSLLGMSSVAQAGIVDLDCVYENLVGSQNTHNITIDLDRKTFRASDRQEEAFFEGPQVEITNEFVSAEKFGTGTIAFSAQHQISRVTLSYVYVYGMSGLDDPIKNRFEGQCELVTRKRAF